MEEDVTLKTLAENLRVERARKKYSQDVLAEKAGISQKSLNRVENLNMNPSIVTVAKLAQALGVSIDTLLPLKE